MRFVGTYVLVEFRKTLDGKFVCASLSIYFVNYPSNVVCLGTLMKAKAESA